MFDNRPLYFKPEGVETRWVSRENPRVEKGKAAQSCGGRKGSAWFPLKAEESNVLAEEKKVSGTIRRIWANISGEDWVPIVEKDITITMLRGLRLDFY